MPTAGGVKAGRAYVLIEALDKTGPVLKSVARRLDRLGSSIAQLGFRMLQFGTIAAVPFVAATRIAMSFSDAMLDLQNQLGATDGEMVPLEQRVRALGRSTSFTAVQVARAAAALAKGDFSLQEVAVSLQDVLNLARAGGMEMEDAAKVMVRSIRVFDMSASDASKVADYFFLAAREGTTDVSELAQAFSYSGQTLKEMGFGLTEALPILAKLANQMLFSTKAGTAVNKAFLDLGSQADKIKEVYGVDIYGPGGELTDRIKILRDLTEAMRGMTTQQRMTTLTEIFNIRGARAILGIMRTYEGIVGARGELLEGAGAAAAAAKKRDSEIYGSIMRIKSALDDLAISVAKAIEPLVLSFEKTVVPIINLLSKWSEANPELFRSTLKLIGAVLVGGAALVVFGGALKLIAFALVPVAALVTGVISVLGGLFSMIGAVSAMLMGGGGLAAAGGLFSGLLSGLMGLVTTLGPALLVFGSIGLGIYAATKYLGGFDAALKGVHSRFLGLKGVAHNAISNIVKRFQAGDLEGAFKVVTKGFNLAWISVVTQMKVSWANVVFFIKETWLSGILVLKSGILSFQENLGLMIWAMVIGFNNGIQSVKLSLKKLPLVAASVVASVADYIFGMVQDLFKSILFINNKMRETFPLMPLFKDPDVLTGAINKLGGMREKVRASGAAAQVGAAQMTPTNLMDYNKVESFIRGGMNLRRQEELGKAQEALDKLRSEHIKAADGMRTVEEEALRELEEAMKAVTDITKKEDAKAAEDDKEEDFGAGIPEKIASTVRDLPGALEHGSVEFAKKAAEHMQNQKMLTAAEKTATETERTANVVEDIAVNLSLLPTVLGVV